MISKLFITLLSVIVVLTLPSIALAGRGCCSWHGGQDYCDSDTGRWVCNDGTYSPSCMCESSSYRAPARLSCPRNSSDGGDGSCYCNVGYALNTSKSACVFDGVYMCSIKYPGSFFRTKDKMCACTGDKLGKSRWNSSSYCN